MDWRTLFLGLLLGGTAIFIVDLLILQRWRRNLGSGPGSQELHSALSRSQLENVDLQAAVRRLEQELAQRSALESAGGAEAIDALKSEVNQLKAERDQLAEMASLAPANDQAALVGQLQSEVGAQQQAIHALQSEVEAARAERDLEVTRLKDELTKMELAQTMVKRESEEFRRQAQLAEERDAAFRKESEELQQRLISIEQESAARIEASNTAATQEAADSLQALSAEHEALKKSFAAVSSQAEWLSAKERQLSEELASAKDELSRQVTAISAEEDQKYRSEIDRLEAVAAKLPAVEQELGAKELRIRDLENQLQEQKMQAERVSDIRPFLNQIEELRTQLKQAQSTVPAVSGSDVESMRQRFMVVSRESANYQQQLAAALAQIEILKKRIGSAPVEAGLRALSGISEQELMSLESAGITNLAALCQTNPDQVADLLGLTGDEVGRVLHWQSEARRRLNSGVA